MLQKALEDALQDLSRVSDGLHLSQVASVEANVGMGNRSLQSDPRWFAYSSIVLD